MPERARQAARRAAVTTTLGVVLSCHSAATLTGDAAAEGGVTDGTSEATLTDAEASEVPEAAPPIPPEPSPPPNPAWTGWKKVVLLGDSMVGFQFGLSVALEKRFAAEKIAFTAHPWTSEGIQTLSDDQKLERTLAYEKPSAVFVSLGTNNLTAPHPEAFVGRIRKIAREASAHGRACYWLSPPAPSWGWNHAIVAVLRDNAAPCVFFDSTDLVLERQSDGVHPTNKGGEAWAAAIWEFLRDERSADGGP